MDDANHKELQERLHRFVAFRKEHLTGDEKGEAQVFLERLFRALGHEGVIEAGGKLEKRVRKRGGGRVAFADLVWRPALLLEMKRVGEDLARHYQQAFEYWIDLVPDRPAYVVLCNFDEFWIYDLNRQLDEPLARVALDDLPRQWEALGFMLPHPVQPVLSNDLVAVTREAAATLVRVANSLIERGVERRVAQRFVMQCLVSMVAEDAGLLPTHLFTRALEDGALKGQSTYDLVFGLFREMNQPGITPAGRYAGTPYFNGLLYADLTPIELTVEELHALHHAATFDWTAVRPEIFGTLFEQSLGRDERHAFGAHFTSGADIQRIVLPTIVRPWRERIEQADTLTELGRVEQELLSYRVLDPACGCGNFLYLAYREMRRLEKVLDARRREISTARRAPTAALSFVQPNQFFGIDINPFAVEIAKVTLMLGKQLTAVEDGDEHRALPLDDLDDNFQTADALFTEWPAADAIIGNPPYLGRRRLVEERGAAYADELRQAFPEVGGVSDYVVYWFRRSHDHLPKGGRAGLVGTNTIRQTDTRKVGLDYIIDRGGTIYDAWSSLPWSGDANVHVSIVNWVKGPVEGDKTLWVDDGQRKINPPVIFGALSENLDLRAARDLRANKEPKVAFQGQTAGHTEGFVIDEADAARIRAADPGSATTIHPYLTADDLLHRARPTRWIIDLDASDAATAKASAPAAYEHVRTRVLPDRQIRAERERERNAEALEQNPDARLNRHHERFLDTWWMLSYRRADFLQAARALDRYIVLPGTASEHRRPVLEFVDPGIRPSHALQAFVLSDDYSFGVLQSRAHEIWFRERCSTLEGRLRYTAKSIFYSFPWPQQPDESDVRAVAQAAAELLEFRHQTVHEGFTLAELYDTLNDPGTNRLRKLHANLDDAVNAAYGFDTGTATLDGLLSLNALCAEREDQGLAVTPPGDPCPPIGRISHVKLVM